MSYLVEQLPHCDLLRLSLSTGWFVLSARQVVRGSEGVWVFFISVKLSEALQPPWVFRVFLLILSNMSGTIAPQWLPSRSWLRFQLKGSTGPCNPLGFGVNLSIYQTCVLQAGPQPCIHSLLSESLLLPPFTSYRVFCHDVYNFGSTDLKFLYITSIMTLKQYLFIYL